MSRQFGYKLKAFLLSPRYKIFKVNFVRRVVKMTKHVLRFVARKLHLRERYLLTRRKNLRLRYVTAVFVFLFTGLSALTLVSQNSNAVSISAMNMAAIAPATGYENDIGNIINGGLYGDISLVSMGGHDLPMKEHRPLPLDREVTINAGDALGVVMERQGIGAQEAAIVIKAMAEHYDPRRIKAGQKIQMHFDKAAADQQRFREMKIQLDPIKTLVVARAGNRFDAEVHEKKVGRVVRAKQALVELSLYGSAAKAGIPQGVVAEAIHIFSWNVDFQRDIRPKDSLEIMYESYETESGYVAKNGNILYAKLTLSGREIPLYRYKMADGRIDYFQPDGRSIKRTLMKTPINGARMSSGFGKRRHPVLGYTKMHKGIDFAASKGSPIFAAGDGIIEKAGWFSSYGKYVRIRHNSKLKTAYAHMSKIRSSVKSGTRVTQGQVIGYVGSTGRSTGPHLHYEVLSGGRQVNPRSVNLPTGEELTGKDKNNFKAIVRKADDKFASALEGTKIAERKSKKRSVFN